MAKIINVVSQTSVKVNTSLDKEELKNLNQVSSHPTFSNEGNWRLVIGVFKHTNSRRRMVCAFKGSFNSLVPMRIRSGTQAGDAYELRKILIVSQNNQGILSIPRSDIASVSDYDFVIGEVAAPENFSATISSEAAASVYAPFNSSVSFNKSVTNFSLNKLSITNGTASNLNGSGSSFSFTVTPTGEGQVTISILAGQVSAADGSVNTVSNSLQKQYYAPVSASINTASGSNSFSEPFAVNVVFNKSVTNFDVTNVIVTNGSASNFNGSGTNYNFLVTPNQDGQVSIELDMSDVVGQDGSTPSTPPSPINASYISPLAVSMSYEAPGGSGGSGSNVVNGPFTIYVTFNKPVSNFELGDLSITNGIASNLTALNESGTSFSFTVTPTSDGAVSASVISGSVQGPSGEGNNEPSSPIDATFVDLKTLNFDTASGHGIGTVTASLNGQTIFSSRRMTSTQTVSYDFQPGDNVQLSARADIDNYFVGYNGSITSSSHDLNLLMNEDKNVSAGFNKSYNTVLKSYGAKMKFLPDNKIIVYSANSVYVTRYAGLVYNFMRLNEDRTVDTTFPLISFNGQVYNFAIDSFGNYWVVGSFTSYTGPISAEAAAKGFTSGQANNANRIAKLNSAGQLMLINSSDTAGFTGNGFDNRPEFIAIDSSNNVWAGGAFNTYYGQDYVTPGTSRGTPNNANYIAKLNSAGVLQKINSGDTAGSTGNGFNSNIFSIAIDSSNNVWAGGGFTAYRSADYVTPGTSRGTAFNANYIAKLNSAGVLQKINSGDTAGSSSNGFNSAPWTIVMDSGNNVWIGGNFTTYRSADYVTPGTSRGTLSNANRIAKLNSAGVLQKINSSDTASFNGNGFNSTVNVVSIKNNGDILLGGTFTESYIEYLTNAREAVYLMKDGAQHYLDYSLNFSRYNNTHRSLNTLGLFNLSKIKFIPNSGEKIALFGNFTVQKNSKKWTNMVRLEPFIESDSYYSQFNVDEGFGGNTSFNGQVNDFAIDSFGNYWVVGSFTSYTGPISAEAAAKGFTSGQANNANRIAKLNSAGQLMLINSSDTAGSTGNGFNSNIFSIAIDSSNNVWAGGNFATYFSQDYVTPGTSRGTAFNANYIAKLNSAGVLQKINSGDTAGSTGNGFNNNVTCITIDSSNNVWVGGNFATYFSQDYVTPGISRGTASNANYIAKLNSAGVLQKINSGDTAGSTGNGFNSTVTCITIDSSNNVWAGGYFYTYRSADYVTPGTSRGTAYNATYIAKLNSAGVLQKINSGDTASFNSNGFNSNVNCITIDSSNNVWVGGGFNTYFSQDYVTPGTSRGTDYNANYIAKLNSAGVLQKINSSDTASFNGNGFNSTVTTIIVDSNGNVFSALSSTIVESYIGTQKQNNVDITTAHDKNLILIHQGNSTRTW